MANSISGKTSVCSMPLRRRLALGLGARQCGRLAGERGDAALELRSANSSTLISEKTSSVPQMNSAGPSTAIAPIASMDPCGVAAVVRGEVGRRPR